MKKLTFLATAALMCALACPGCSGDGFDEINGTPENSGTPDNSAVEGGIRTLSVGMAQFGGPGTRASFGEEGEGGLSLVWDANDRIIAYETAGEHASGHAYQLVGSGGSGNGTFAYAGGQTAPASIAEIYYPEALAAGGFAVPASQTYTPGSFDPAANVMRAAVGDPGEPIVFESRASVACFRLTGNGEAVTSVRLDLTPSGGAAKSYTLACPEGVTLSSEAVAFYIVVEGSADPCDAAFTVSVDGTETMVQKTTAPKTFANGTVVRFPAVAYAKNLYRVMDYWPNEDDPEGIVYAVTENGLHGRMISLNLEGRGRWGSAGPNGTEGFIERTNGVPSMSVNGDGLTITRELVSLRKDQSNFATDYVLFNWLYETANGGNLDGGWYAPSREELKELCLVMSGLDPTKVEWDAFKNATSGVDSKPIMPSWDETTANRTAFSKMMTDKGGVKIDFTSRHSSVIETAEDGKRVYVLQLSAGCFQEHPKGNEYGRMRPHKHF